MELCVAGIQMDVTKNVQQNVETICRAVQKASSAAVDILLTPEGSLSGYTPDFNQAEVEAGLAEVTSLAARLHIELALGTCFKEMDGLTYNQIRFYSPQGIYLGSIVKFYNPQGEWVCRVDSLGEQFFVHTISLLPASKPGS